MLLKQWNLNLYPLSLSSNWYRSLASNGTAAVVLGSLKGKKNALLPQQELVPPETLRFHQARQDASKHLSSLEALYKEVTELAAQAEQDRLADNAEEARLLAHEEAERQEEARKEAEKVEAAAAAAAENERLRLLAEKKHRRAQQEQQRSQHFNQRQQHAEYALSSIENEPFTPFTPTSLPRQMSSNALQSAPAPPAPELAGRNQPERGGVKGGMVGHLTTPKAIAMKIKPFEIGEDVLVRRLGRRRKVAPPAAPTSAVGVGNIVADPTDGTSVGEGGDDDDTVASGGGDSIALDDGGGDTVTAGDTAVNSAAAAEESTVSGSSSSELPLPAGNDAAEGAVSEVQNDKQDKTEEPGIEASEWEVTWVVMRGVVTDKLRCLPGEHGLIILDKEGKSLGNLDEPSPEDANIAAGAAATATAAAGAGATSNAGNVEDESAEGAAAAVSGAVDNTDVEDNNDNSRHLSVLERFKAAAKKVKAAAALGGKAQSAANLVAAAKERSAAASAYEGANNGGSQHSNNSNGSSSSSIAGQGGEHLLVAGDFVYSVDFSAVAGDFDFDNDEMGDSDAETLWASLGGTRGEPLPWERSLDLARLQGRSGSDVDVASLSVDQQDALIAALAEGSNHGDGASASLYSQLLGLDDASTLDGDDSQEPEEPVEYAALAAFEAVEARRAQRIKAAADAVTSALEATKRVNAALDMNQGSSDGEGEGVGEEGAAAKPEKKLPAGIYALFEVMDSSQLGTLLKRQELSAKEKDIVGDARVGSLKRERQQVASTLQQEEAEQEEIDRLFEPAAREAAERAAAEEAAIVQAAARARELERRRKEVMRLLFGADDDDDDGSSSGGDSLAKAARKLSMEHVKAEDLMRVPKSVLLLERRTERAERIRYEGRELVSKCLQAARDARVALEAMVELLAPYPSNLPPNDLKGFRGGSRGGSNHCVIGYSSSTGGSTTGSSGDGSNWRKHQLSAAQDNALLSALFATVRLGLQAEPREVFEAVQPPSIQPLHGRYNPFRRRESKGSPNMAAAETETYCDGENGANDDINRLLAEDENNSPISWTSLVAMSSAATTSSTNVVPTSTSPPLTSSTFPEPSAHVVFENFTDTGSALKEKKMSKKTKKKEMKRLLQPASAVGAGPGGIRLLGYSLTLSSACLRVLGAACYRHRTAAERIARTPGFELCLRAALAPAKGVCSFNPTRTAEAKRPWMLGSSSSSSLSISHHQQEATKASPAAATPNTAPSVSSPVIAPVFSVAIPEGTSGARTGVRSNAIYEDDDDEEDVDLSAALLGLGDSDLLEETDVPASRTVGGALPIRTASQSASDAAVAQAEEEETDEVKKPTKYAVNIDTDDNDEDNTNDNDDDGEDEDSEAYHASALSIANDTLDVCTRVADCSWQAHAPLLRALAPLLHALESRRGRTLPLSLAPAFCRCIATLATATKSHRNLEPAVWVLDAILQRGAAAGEEGGGQKWGAPEAACAIALLKTSDSAVKKGGSGDGSGSGDLDALARVGGGSGSSGSGDGVSGKADHPTLMVLAQQPGVVSALVDLLHTALQGLPFPGTERASSSSSSFGVNDAQNTGEMGAMSGNSSHATQTLLPAQLSASPWKVCRVIARLSQFPPLRAPLLAAGVLPALHTALIAGTCFNNLPPGYAKKTVPLSSPSFSKRWLTKKHGRIGMNGVQGGAQEQEEVIIEPVSNAEAAQFWSAVAVVPCGVLWRTLADHPSLFAGRCAIVDAVPLACFPDYVPPVPEEEEEEFEEEESLEGDDSEEGEEEEHEEEEEEEDDNDDDDEESLAAALEKERAHAATQVKCCSLHVKYLLWDTETEEV